MGQECSYLYTFTETLVEHYRSAGQMVGKRSEGNHLCQPGETIAQQKTQQCCPVVSSQKNQLSLAEQHRDQVTPTFQVTLTLVIVTFLLVLRCGHLLQVFSHSAAKYQSFPTVR